MMTRILWCSLLVVCFFTTCQKPQNTGYTRDEQGYYYKLLAIGDGKQSADTASILFCSATVRTQKDSIFFNSSYAGAGGFYMTLHPSAQASGKHHFLKMTEGDSLSLMVEKTCFFKAYFDTLVPYFLVRDSLVKLDVKILSILNKKDFAKATVKWINDPTEDKELQELKLVDEYLKKHYPGVTADENGVYILEHRHTDLEKALSGKKIKISYSGFYLNGNPVENGRQQLEFILGTPDQLIKGLNIVIHHLKKGETTKIIVPSRLAFGESGSTNGSIPPYTPLLYDLTLIDIK
jgi:FKBP-type peptidyl-prolyl cis-trans isomerase FkpA